MKQNSNVIHGVEAKKSDSTIEQENKVRCLTLNLSGYKMLLPNVSVAEVTELKNITPKSGAPEWFSGLMTWRDQDVPVVVFEKVMNEELPVPEKCSRVLILNAPDNKDCSPFIALGCQSIPSLSLIDEERVAVSDIKGEQAAHIKLDGENYIIPDISLLESMVSKVMAE